MAPCCWKFGSPIISNNADIKLEAIESGNKSAFNVSPVESAVSLYLACKYFSGSIPFAMTLNSWALSKYLSSLFFDSSILICDRYMISMEMIVRMKATRPQIIIKNVNSSFRFSA